MSLEEMEANGIDPGNAMVYQRTVDQEYRKSNDQKDSVHTDGDFTKTEFTGLFSSEKFVANLNHLKSLTGSNDISIIGFWSRDKESGDFICYHYFLIPNLIQNHRLKKCLFLGEDDNIFLLHSN